MCLLTYLCPSLPVEHRPSTTPRHCTLFWAALVILDQFVLLFQLCFSVSPPTVARPASLSLPLRVPGQGLTCGAGCWLPEGVSDPADPVFGGCLMPQLPCPVSLRDGFAKSSVCATTMKQKLPIKILVSPSYSTLSQWI